MALIVPISVVACAEKRQREDNQILLAKHIGTSSRNSQIDFPEAWHLFAKFAGVAQLIRTKHEMAVYRKFSDSYEGID